MYFDEAVGAHVRWKTGLRSLLDRTGDSVDGTDASSDSHRDLGRWIRSAGARWGSPEPQSTLPEAHARFHERAGRVVALTHEGRKADAEALLAPDGEFAHRADETVIALMGTQREAACGRLAPTRRGLRRSERGLAAPISRASPGIRYSSGGC